MCVIIYKPAGETVSKKNIEDAWKGNSDGFGLMYYDPEEDKVVSHKKLEPTMEEIHEWFDKLKDTDAAFHMRITTHGDTIEQLCHPFRVLHRKKHGKDLFFMHNGIIGKAPKAPDKLHSDTTMFNKTLLQPMLSNNPEFMEEETFNDLIEGYIGHSKLLFLDSNGKFTFANRDKFSKLDGTDVLVSNTRWQNKPKKAVATGYPNYNYGGGYYGGNNKNYVTTSNVVQGSYKTQRFNKRRKDLDTYFDRDLKDYVYMPEFANLEKTFSTRSTKSTYHHTYHFGEREDARYFLDNRAWLAVSEGGYPEGFIYYDETAEDWALVSESLYITSKPTTAEVLGLSQDDIIDMTYTFEEMAMVYPQFNKALIHIRFDDISDLHEELVANESDAGVEEEEDLEEYLDTTEEFGLFSLPEADVKSTLRSMSGSELLNIVSEQPEKVTDFIKQIL